MIYIVSLCNSADVVKKVFCSQLSAEDWIKKQDYTEELRPGEWYKFFFKGDNAGPKDRYVIRAFTIEANEAFG